MSILDLATRPVGAALLVAALYSCAADQPHRDNSHYAIDATVDPHARFVGATLDLSFLSPADGLQELTFYLHRQLSLELVDGSLVVSHSSVDPDSTDIPYMPEARAILIQLSRPLAKGERTDLRFEYEGIVDTWPWWLANHISEEWLELGLYFPWFPYNYEEYGVFTFDVDLTIDSAYELRSFGTAKRTSSGWHFESRVPTNDIVVAGSRDLRTRRFRGDGYSVQVHFYFLGEVEVQQLGREAVRVLSKYSEWFGEIDQRSLNLIQSKRSHGGGYSRPGLVVLGQMVALLAPGGRQADLLHYMAHEAAHMWWRRALATSWEDWLNESFAEYSALLAVRDRLGDEEYVARIARKREQAEGTRPIWGLERSDFSSDERSREIRMALYSKGPVLLHELAERIGREGFLAWCRELVRSDVSTTDEALRLLGILEGESTAQWFRALLQSQ
jgi:hypothetical protein